MSTGQAISDGWRRPVICPYCDGEAELVAALVVYPYNQAKQQSHTRYWYCSSCKAWTGVNGKTDEPIGTMAQAPLRAFRAEVREHLLSLVKRKMERQGCSMKEAHAAAAGWLAREAKFPGEAFFIPVATEEQCRAALKALAPYVKART